MKLPLWLKVSRPRFWIYLLGPFVLGALLVAVQTGAVPWYLWPWLLYFTYPANVFLYGFEECLTITPGHDHEHELDEKTAKRQNIIGLLIAASHVPFIFLIWQLQGLPKIAFFAFLFLAFFSSSPPFRFKSRPALCWVSYLTYVSPLLFGAAFIANH